MRSTSLVAVVALAALGLGACGDDDAASSPPVYGTDTSAITVAAGEEFTIELDSNPSTGYEWQLVDGVGDIVTVADRTFEGPTGSMVGAPGVQRFTFTALRTGSTTLSFEYVRSWEEPPQPAQTASFSVTVT